MGSTARVRVRVWVWVRVEVGVTCRVPALLYFSRNMFVLVPVKVAPPRAQLVSPVAYT